MRTKKTTAVIVAVVMVLLCVSLCLTGCEDKGYTWLDSVNIVARLTEEGDLVVSETWHAVITEDEIRNLYRNISVKDADFGVNVEITDFSVSDANGTSYTELINPSNPSGSNANRGAKNVYYLYDYGNSTVELGCYFERVDYTEKTVTFNYTLRNMARKYNDCVELYWKIIDEDFSLYVKDLSVELYLPSGAVVTDETCFWLHTEVDDSDTENQSDRMVFSAEKLSTGNYFEIRALTPVSLYSDVVKTRDESVLESIYQTELTEYEAYMAEIKKRNDLGIFSIVASCLMAVGGVVFAVFYPKHYKKSKGLYPEYLREIPEEFTVAEAGHFFYYYTGGGKGARNRGKLFSATIVDLARKGYVNIAPISDGKSYTLAVSDVPEAKKSELKKHEECLLSLIGRVEKNAGHPFTPDEFTSFAKTHYEDVNSTLNEFLTASSYMLKNGGHVGAKNAVVFAVIGAALIALGFVVLMNGEYLNLTGPGLTVFGLLLLLFSPKVPKLTEKGEEKYELTQGLKRFMLDFTNLKEHELPALILWEEYMVYATMMGISEAVLKNLKLKYPELTSEENTGYGGYYYGRRNFIFTYYMLSGRASYDLGRSLDNCFTNVSATAKAIQASKSQNGSGKGGSFGGGFGHGGGGFGGGGGGFGGGGGGAR